MTPRARRDPARDRALYRELAHRLRAAGCFARCDRRYARRLALLVPLFAAGYAALLAVRPGPLWAVLCVAVALVSVQLGIVSHDAGHRQVHRRRLWNDLAGHLGMTFATGLSFSHWRIVHDTHHRTTQDELRDPDMQYGILFSVHDRGARDKRGLARIIGPFQHLYFWPVSSLYSWGLRTDSIARLFRDPARTRVDRWVLPLHYALWLGAPALIVGPLHALLTYVAVSSVIGVNLLAIFAPNHMGMPAIAPGDQLTRLEQEIVGTRDVTGGRWLGWLMHGLEHQIEHHLFPRMGHAQLARARVIVTAFCAEHGLPHAEASFAAAHRQVLGHMARMGRVVANADVTVRDREATPG